MAAERTKSGSNHTESSTGNTNTIDDSHNKVEDVTPVQKSVPLIVDIDISDTILDDAYLIRGS